MRFVTILFNKKKNRLHCKILFEFLQGVLVKMFRNETINIKFCYSNCSNLTIIKYIKYGRL